MSVHMVIREGFYERNQRNFEGRFHSLQYRMFGMSILR